MKFEDTIIIKKFDFIPGMGYPVLLSVGEDSRNQKESYIELYEIYISYNYEDPNIYFEELEFKWSHDISFQEKLNFGIGRLYENSIKRIVSSEDPAEFEDNPLIEVDCGIGVLKDLQFFPGFGKVKNFINDKSFLGDLKNKLHRLKEISYSVKREKSQNEF